MNREPKIVLITADGLRHRFAAQKLSENLNLAGIISEAKAPLITPTTLIEPADVEVIEQHFAERDAVERRFMGERQDFPDTEILTIPHGASNAPENCDWVRQRDPDYVLLYGSSIIKAPLLDYYDGRMVNLHLGLSPYYRGSGTNFWPLVNREPECVGATIHLAVLRVDAGAILRQVRPVPELDDRAHDLGVKTLIAGLEAMPSVLSGLVSGHLKPLPQDLSIGKVYRQKDFNAAAVRTMWDQFATGMMTEFLANAQERYLHFPII